MWHYWKNELDSKNGKTSNIAQLVKCLPYNHEDLSSIPRIHITDNGMAACAYNPRTGKQDTSQPLCSLDRLWSSLEELQSSEKPCLKEQSSWGMALEVVLWSSQAHTCTATCTHTFTPTYTPTCQEVNFKMCL